MIKAIIQNKSGGTLVTEFPCDIYNLYSELHSVGVTKRPNDVKLTDNEDDPVSVKLYSDSDFGNHLLLLFSESNTLADVNTVCFAIEKADESIKEELEQNLLNDQYKEAQVLYALVLSEHASESDFVSKLVGCFTADQTDEQLIEAVNNAFGTELTADDFEKVMNNLRAVHIDTSG